MRSKIESQAKKLLQIICLFFGVLVATPIVLLLFVVSALASMVFPRKSDWFDQRYHNR